MKGIIAIIICSLITQMAFSQRMLERNELYVGGSIGMNRTTLEGPLIDNHLVFAGRTRGELIPRRGFSAFIYAKYIPVRFVYLKTGFGYFQKGGETNSNLIRDVIAPVNYFTVPLLLGLSPLSGHKFRIAFETGISFNFFDTCNEEGCLDVERTYRSPYNPETDPDIFKVRNPAHWMVGVTTEFEFNSNFVVFVNYMAFKDLDFFYGIEEGEQTVFNDGIPSVIDAEEFSATHKGNSISMGVFVSLSRFK